jgi:hypothetical protein
MFLRVFTNIDLKTTVSFYFCYDFTIISMAYLSLRGRYRTQVLCHQQAGCRHDCGKTPCVSASILVCVCMSGACMFMHKGQGKRQQCSESAVMTGVCVCVCIYIYIYIYTHTLTHSLAHTYTHTHLIHA